MKGKYNSLLSWNGTLSRTLQLPSKELIVRKILQATAAKTNEQLRWGSGNSICVLGWCVKPRAVG